MKLINKKDDLVLITRKELDYYKRMCSQGIIEFCVAERKQAVLQTVDEVLAMLEPLIPVEIANFVKNTYKEEYNNG